MIDGCGVPSMILLKNKGRVMIVEVGVISRGEVGVLVSCVGVAIGMHFTNIYIL